MKDFHALLKTAQIPGSCASQIARRRWCRNRSGNLWFGFVECGGLKSAIAVERLRICSTKCQLPSFDILETQDLPVEERTETLRAVTLIDSLTSCFLSELEHLIGQLIDTFIDRFHASVHNVNTVIVWMFNELFHVASKSREIRGDGRNTTDDAFGWCVTPRLVIGWEDSELTSSDEIVVVKR